MSIKPTLAEKVYNQLKEDIIHGKYELGSELTEAALSDIFNVSRTPIREALRRLEKDMIVRIIRHKGAMVTKPTLKDIVEINNLREVLEGLATGLAVKFAKDEDIESIYMNFPEVDGVLKPEQFKTSYEAGHAMHQFIYTNSGNERLINILENIQNQVEIIMLMNANIPGRYEEAYKEHLDIITSIKNRQEEKAVQAMRKHIQNVHRSLIDYNRFSL